VPEKGDLRYPTLGGTIFVGVFLGLAAVLSMWRDWGIWPFIPAALIFLLCNHHRNEDHEEQGCSLRHPAHRDPGIGHRSDPRWRPLLPDQLNQTARRRRDRPDPGGEKEGDKGG
jgi:hypothetical protein